MKATTPLQVAVQGEAARQMRSEVDGDTWWGWVIRQLCKEKEEWLKETGGNLQGDRRVTDRRAMGNKKRKGAETSGKKGGQKRVRSTRD